MSDIELKERNRDHNHLLFEQGSYYVIFCFFVYNSNIIRVKILFQSDVFSLLVGYKHKLLVRYVCHIQLFCV